MLMEEDLVSIFIGNELACDEPRADRQAYTGVTVYMSDPWHAAAGVDVSNLYMVV